MSRKLLIIGGNGQLGSVVVNSFRFCKLNPWNVTNLDFSANNSANKNVDIREFSKSFEVDELYRSLDSAKFDSIISVAGGWEGHGLDDKNIFKSIDNMMKMNFNSSVLAAHLATKFLKEDSTLIFTGAAAVKKELDCTFMLSYQLSKQSVFNLTDTLIKYPKILPKGTKIVNICPGVIDTATNRKYMADADKSQWVTPEKISTLFKGWAENPNSTPKDVYYNI